MVVLGCSIEYIQQDRIQTALKYAVNNDKDNKFIWFLTGGVKYALSIYENNKKSESSTMAMYISSAYTQIIIDEYSKNTAENFNMLKQHLLTKYVNNNLGIPNIPNIVITTSEYHQARANQIFDGVFSNFPVRIYPIWNLGKQSCDYCWGDEVIHMRNVDADVLKVLKLELDMEHQYQKYQEQQNRLRGFSPSKI